jgi:RNA polymerase sigma factor (sigma-70 family)
LRAARLYHCHEHDAPMMEDREMVLAVLSRKPGAFAQLVRQHERLVGFVIGRMVRHSEDTRDLAQETFLRVHQQLHQFRFDSALKSWIGRIAWSIALRHVQKKQPELVLDTHAHDDLPALSDSVPDSFDLEAACADAQLRAMLHAAIEALAPVPRTVLTLYHLEELTIADITHITGMPAGTIKSHLFRARLLLREALEPHMKGMR